MNLIKALIGMMAVMPAKTKIAVSGKNGHSSSSPQWAEDRLAYWPVHDRGGAMSDYEGPGDGGMLGVLARIELNEEDGRNDLYSGLPKHALQPHED